MIQAVILGTPLSAALWYLVFSYPLYAVPIVCAAVAVLHWGHK